jgi:hypothetical protein
MKQKRSNYKPKSKLKRINNHYKTLELLHTATPKLRKAILLNGGPGLLKSIAECVLNVTAGNIDLKACIRRKLQKYKGQLRKVSDKRVSLAKKKKLIVQSGGWLLPLLTAVLPALASLLMRKSS